MEGLVIRNTGSSYIVADNVTGTEVACKVKGNFRLRGIRTTNPVAVGDRVTYDSAGYITAIAPRRNYIIRRASNLSKESHILAANIDCALLVVTLAHPTTSTTFIDRFLATSEAYSVPVIICINKVDLLTAPEDRELLDAVAGLYRHIGYPVVEVSARKGIGIERLAAMLSDKTTLISGNSGVGKSTLINALIPGLELKTGELSDVHDTGMHTTTFSEMYTLPSGERLIDTPGVRGFGTIDMKPAEVSHYFPEIFALQQDCRYGNCTHTHEPGCAVLEAVNEHRIAQSRYNSYLSILEDADADRYRHGYK